MYHTEPPTDKTIREWYMNSSRVAACALRNEQAVRAHRPGRPRRMVNTKVRDERSVPAYSGSQSTDTSVNIFLPIDTA